MLDSDRGKDMFKESPYLTPLACAIDYSLDLTAEREYVIKEKLLAILSSILFVSLIGVTGVVSQQEFKQTGVDGNICEIDSTKCLNR